MDSFGDILYVVVIVAAVLSSVVKSFGKKSEKRSESAPQPDESAPNWTTYSDEAPAFSDDFEPQPEPETVAPIAPQPTAAEGDRSIHKHAATAETPQPDEPTTPTIDFTDMDEVKRAVIANEILTRKYF